MPLGLIRRNKPTFSRSSDSLTRALPHIWDAPSRLDRPRGSGSRVFPSSYISPSSSYLYPRTSSDIALVMPRVKMTGHEGEATWQDSLIPVPRKTADHTTRATHPHLLPARLPSISHYPTSCRNQSPAIHLPASSPPPPTW